VQGRWLASGGGPCLQCLISGSDQQPILQLKDAVGGLVDVGVVTGNHHRDAGLGDDLSQKRDDAGAGEGVQMLFLSISPSSSILDGNDKDRFRLPGNGQRREHRLVILTWFG
jgi:hypothetical protein